MSFGTFSSAIGAVGFVLIAIFLGVVRGEWPLAAAFLVMAALMGLSAWLVIAVGRRRANRVQP